MKFRKTALVLVALLFLGLFSFASFVPNIVASPDPDKLDVVFCFDLSGSMGDDIAAAKKMASDLMNCLNAVPWLDVRFGVITYVDYPYYYSYCGYSNQYGSPPDYAYALNVSLTYNKALVNNTIQALRLFWGADYPQDHARIMHEGWNDPAIGWRSECTVKIMIDFSDSVPHDHNLNEGISPGVWNTGVDPGRDALAGTADDLDLQTEIANLVNNDIEWFEIHGRGTGLTEWGYWAGWTNGKAYDLHATTSSQVNTDIVNKVIAHQHPAPQDVELYPQRVENLGDPIDTTWHELHPVKSRYYNVTDWKPGRVLSPGDQIDMINETGGKEWFQVDEVTVDIVVNETDTGIVRWLEYKCGYWVFKKEVERNPISSKWNELKSHPPGPYTERCWHLTSWEDTNFDGKLSPCDIIDMTPMHPEPGPTTWFHVLNVTVTLKLTKKPMPPFIPYWLEFRGTLDEFQKKDYIHDPLNTSWHEILPVQSRIWNLTSWEDFYVLSPSDKVELIDEHETKRWFHVDKLTVAMNMTSELEPESWRIVKFEGSLEDFKKYYWSYPVSTQWHEVNPNYSRQWHLTIWEDSLTDPDGKLSHCDRIFMIDKETGQGEYFHVETLSTDMWLNVELEIPPPDTIEWIQKWPAPDYAPSGVPDFDQKQNDTWKNPFAPYTGNWSWSGPVAVANSLWWWDSYIDGGTNPPPTIEDHFPLVQNYGPWDDHDPRNVQPLIEHLARLMETDEEICGTNVTLMQEGIRLYLEEKGLNMSFYEKTLEPCTFNFTDIVHEIERCEDVVLLLGFYQWKVKWVGELPEIYLDRIGGHYVTVAGVGYDWTTGEPWIKLSDPFFDYAEDMGWGPPYVPSPHLAHPGNASIHNNAKLVSHDPYKIDLTPPPLLLRAHFGIEDYPADDIILQHGLSANGPVSGPYNETQGEIETVVEYAVVFSPKQYDKPPYIDYAWSKMPDFDQRQDNWTNPVTGKWSWCGPVAVANSLWWMDSKFEPGNTPPPAISDGFPLVQNYGPWDDHDPRNVGPFVSHLASLMNTDVGKNGTNVYEMQAGIREYLREKGLSDRFYERTWGPCEFTFGDIEYEVEQSEDVILLLGFYEWKPPGEWVRVSGHYVTVSGVNANGTIKFSDPAMDAAEMGLTKGEVLPPGHIHPPWPAYPMLHNDTWFVSHDYYNVVPSRVPGLHFGIEGYPYYEYLYDFAPQGEPAEPWDFGEVFTAVEYAVIISPLPAPPPVHDVAIIDVTRHCNRTVVGRGMLPRIHVTTENQGNFTENFTVSAYCQNATGDYLIGSQPVILAAGANTTLTFFWNTSGLKYMPYTIMANATVVPGETDTADNTKTDPTLITVTIVGDIDGDGYVYVLDLSLLGASWRLRHGHPKFNSNADIDCDDYVYVLDLSLLGAHWRRRVTIDP